MDVQLPPTRLQTQGVQARERDVEQTERTSRTETRRTETSRNELVPPARSVRAPPVRFDNAR